MPTDAVWVIVTIPKKDYENELKAIKKANLKNNNIYGSGNIKWQCMDNIVDWIRLDSIGSFVIRIIHCQSIGSKQML